MDAVRWEASSPLVGWCGLREREREREQTRSAAHRAMEGRGVDTSTGSESSSEGEEEGEITLLRLSSLCITPPPLSDVVSWQAWGIVSECRLKQTQIRDGSSTNAPRQPHPSLVTSDNKEGDKHCVRVNEIDPPFWDFVGPGNFGSHRSYQGHGSGDLLAESLRSGALIQESPLRSLPTVVPLVCVCVKSSTFLHDLLLSSPFLSLKNK
jgi:hypothetical protein